MYYFILLSCRPDILGSWECGSALLLVVGNQINRMKTMTCECGHVEQGASENDVASKMESHISNDHPERTADHKKMMNDARKTLTDAVMA